VRAPPTRRWLYAGLALAAGVGLVRVLARGPRIAPGTTRILLIGDSMAEGLAAPLRALAGEQRVGFEALTERGTRIDQWADRDIGASLTAFKPTLVIVVLGTNDEYMKVRDAGKRQAAPLARLLARLQGVEYVWIAPLTLPKPASNGTVALLHQTIPGAQLFPSESLQVPRGPDKLHPSARGYAGWAGALWQWLS